MQAASVNLATETAVVRVLLPDGSSQATEHRARQQQQADERPQQAQQPPAAAADDGADLEAGLSPHERQLATMGTGLARMLTDAGYAATMRQQGGGSSASSKVVAAKREERLRRLRWAVCGTGPSQQGARNRARVQLSLRWQLRCQTNLSGCQECVRARRALMACAPFCLPRVQGDHAAAGGGVAAGLCLPPAPPHALAGLGGAPLAARPGLHAGARRHVGAGAAG